jgi:hypothetical protein
MKKTPTKKAATAKRTAAKKTSKAVKSSAATATKKGISAAIEIKEVATKSEKLASLATAPFRKWNGWLAAILLLQGIAILLFSKGHSYPVTTTYLTQDSLASAATGHPVYAAAMRHLFDANMAWIVALMLFVAAVAHFLAATWCRNRYEAGLEQRVNHFRWIEYALTGAIMMAGLGMLVGVTDISSLLMLFVLTGVAMLTGLVMDYRKRVANWLVYGLGCIVGVTPWVALAVYVWGAFMYAGHLPGFVYGVLGTVFGLGILATINLYLQYKKKGRWADYLYGERIFMIGSLVAKTAIAWIIFAGVLRP